MTNVLTSNVDSLTFHIRVTKKCNADCAYCSSFEANAKDLMSLEELDSSLDFIAEFIIKNNIGGNRKFLTVQYIGGELLTVPFDYLKSFVNKVEDKLSHLFENFRHGCQTNLLGSQQRINDLLELFDGNMGTSLDTFTNQRTIAKSAEKYKTFFLKNLSYTKKLTGKNLSSIIVIDKKMAPFIHEQIQYAEDKKMHLTVRPVFLGGMPIENVDDFSLVEIYKDIFDNWFMKSNISIEPFFSLLEKRLLNHKKQLQLLPSISGCPFQHNCALSSLNLEPDGTLYVCLDMADGKHYPLGNAKKRFINQEVFDLLVSRSQKLSQDCLNCDYFSECQGGCMNEAIEQKNDVFGKTNYCLLWKSIFYSIDKGIKNYSIEDIEVWMKKIQKTF